jgi:hypothetical protein
VSALFNQTAHSLAFCAMQVHHVRRRLAGYRFDYRFGCEYRV